MVMCEVCIESVPDAVTVSYLGIDRLELCADLAVGGTTPSAGLIEGVVRQVEIPVMVMIRPHPGEFTYDASSVRVMLRDIDHVKKVDAAGVVFGALNHDRRIDIEVTRQLIEAARPMEVTYHRAFDLVVDPVEALEQLIELQVDRILTSGQHQTAEEGIDVITSLIATAGGRISIMPGSGVKAHNVVKILQQTGAEEIHFSGGGLVAAALDLAASFGSRFRNEPTQISEMVRRVRRLEQVVE